MPLFAFVGDIHGAIDKMYAYLLNWERRVGKKIDAVIHVGDFTGDPDLRELDRYVRGRNKAPIPTWVCPGNHEPYAVLSRWLKAPDTVHNIRLLPDGEITEVMGVKIGAIWGNFSYKSWKEPARIEQARKNAMIENSQTYQQSKKAMHIHPDSVSRLKAAGEFDVLITHDTSAGMMAMRKEMDSGIREELGLDKGEPVGGCPGFNELYLTGKPRMHLFGHFHRFQMCQAQNPTVVCLHCFNFDPAQSIWFEDVGEDWWRVSGGTASAINEKEFWEGTRK